MEALTSVRPRAMPEVVRKAAGLRLELVPLLAVAGVLNLWHLSQNGWANSFYSAAVRSMSTSWSNFIYASLDPSGVSTIDKTPLATWVQALSVRVFGFHPLSILVPEAVIGTLTVALVYDLTRIRFGRLAGFAAGLALATTPITVAISRHNNPDALLVFCLVAALWCTVRALERGRVAWLIGAGACVGLGFETKMAAALIVLPAIALAWLWVAPRGRLVATAEVLGAGIAATAIGIAWPLFIALTPASQRPWLSGTADNSIWSLITGYNGIGRVAGQAGGPPLSPTSRTMWVFGGAPGPFRLVNDALGLQAGWLLGVAIVGGAAILVMSRLARRDPRTGWLIAVGGSFLATAVVFSTAKGIFHPYYVSLLAPFTAALVGAGLLEIARAGQAARFLAPAAVAAGAVCEIAVVRNNVFEPAKVASALIVGAVVLGALAATVGAPRARLAVLAVALVGLLAAPAVAAVHTLDHRTSTTFPAGGPSIAAAGLGALPPRVHKQSMRDARETRAVLAYVKHHGGGTLGVRSQLQAAYGILHANAAVAGLGGFSGHETVMSPAWFGQAVQAGRIRWVLYNGSLRAHRGERPGVKPLLRAVARTCRRVPNVAYTPRLPITRGALYDCIRGATALERLQPTTGPGRTVL